MKKFMTSLASPFVAVWHFVNGFCYSVKVGFLTIFGRIKVYRWPLWVVYDPVGYQVTSTQIRKAMDMVQPGDVLVRKYVNYLDGYFIPGRFSHSAVYIDDGVIVHAMCDGVQKIDIIDFLRCDEFAILRPKCDDAMKSRACEIAKSYIGHSYDFNFDIAHDYKNMDEVQKRTRSVYCHELTRSCFPDLDVPTIKPTLWNGMIRSSKSQFLAQSFFISKDFEVVYDSKFSELQCSTK